MCVYVSTLNLSTRVCIYNSMHGIHGLAHGCELFLHVHVAVQSARREREQRVCVLTGFIDL